MRHVSPRERVRSGDKTRPNVHGWYEVMGGYDPLSVCWVPDPHSVQVSLFGHLPLPDTVVALELLLRNKVSLVWYSSLVLSHLTSTLDPFLQVINTEGQTARERRDHVER